MTQIQMDNLLTKILDQYVLGEITREEWLERRSSIHEKSIELGLKFNPINCSNTVLGTILK